MKKSFLLTLVLFATFSLRAQTKKTTANFDALAFDEDLLVVAQSELAIQSLAKHTTRQDFVIRKKNSMGKVVLYACPKRKKMPPTHRHNTLAIEF